MKTLQKISQSTTKSEEKVIRVRLSKKSGHKGIVQFVLEQIKLKEPTLIEQFEKIINKIGIKQLEKEHYIKITYCDGDRNPAIMVVEMDIEKIEEELLNHFWSAEAKSHSFTTKNKKSIGVRFVKNW
jgi:hypothetical protein